MEAWAAMATAATLGLVAAAQPGPFQAFLLSRVVRTGRQRSLPLVLAPLLSDGPIALLMIVLVAQAPEVWLTWIGVVGGLVALFLALEAARALRRELRVDRPLSAPDHVAEPANLRGGVVRAALVNAFNPGPWTFWALVLGPLVVTAARRAPWQAVGVVASFYLALIGGLAAIVVAFSAAASLGVRVRITLQGISIAALAMFGGLLITRAFMP